MKDVVVISGLSGSGKSTAVNVLEDLGFYCVDNLPLALLPKFIELCNAADKGIDKVAMVIDIREGVFFDLAPGFIKKLRKEGYLIDVIFLESSDRVLIKRYKETRRKHPLAKDGNTIKAISKEREMLKELKDLANYQIDSSELSVHQLKDIIINKFSKSTPYKTMINILSFGYKHGLPYDADIIVDIRFLPNPYFIDGLKNLNGTDREIQNFVLGKENSIKFIEKFTEFLEFLIPQYEQEGKSYLTIGIGCTGGRHRSVVIANEIAEHFNRLSPTIRHRDISKS